MKVKYSSNPRISFPAPLIVVEKPQNVCSPFAGPSIYCLSTLRHTPYLCDLVTRALLNILFIADWHFLLTLYDLIHFHLCPFAWNGKLSFNFIFYALRWNLESSKYCWNSFLFIGTRFRYISDVLFLLLTNEVSLLSFRLSPLDHRLSHYLKYTFC